jgi:predicted DNA-binding transcriptional regulator AlpA
MTKLMSYDDLVAAGIKYSRPHLWRLYSTGKFPKPIKLSLSRNAWRVEDVEAWIEARAAETVEAA